MGKQTVLLVEDNPILRRATAMLLETHGFTMLAAGSIDEALDCLNAHAECGLVLLDLELGAERGELLYERRGESPRALPPLVVVSGQGGPECQRACDYTRAIGVVRKPYMPAELLAMAAKIWPAESIRERAS